MNFKHRISEIVVRKVQNCGMIKPYGKRFSYVLVHGIRCRNYVTELSARFVSTIVCCTDKGNPRAQSNMGKKMYNINFG